MHFKHIKIYYQFLIIPFLFTILLSVSFVNADLIVHYEFDNGPQDSSGNGYDGTFYGGAVVDYNSECDSNVLVCNGTDGYMSVPKAVFATIDNEITIVLWQYGDVDLQPKNSSVFWGLNDTGTRVLNSHIPWSSAKVYWDAGCSGSSYDRISKETSVDGEYEGMWNNWVFTKDAVAGEMKIYYNGELWFSESGKTRSMAGVESFQIGSGDGYYAGAIDDFRIYDHSLSEEQVLKIYYNWSDYEAHSPTPSNNTEFVPLDTMKLTWQVESPVDSHRIYFSPYNPPRLIGEIADTPSVTKVYDLPTPLRPDKVWYWRVDTVRDGQVEQGDLWKFNTFAPPDNTDKFTFDEIIFIKRMPYSSNHYYTVINNGTSSNRFKAENGIYIYNMRTKQERPVITAAEIPGSGKGVIGNFTLSFDAQKVIFDYRQSTGAAFRIWECNIDGSGLRQITFDAPDEKEKALRYGNKYWQTDDIHPCYLPDGDIMFSSSRCEHIILCVSNGSLVTAVLHRMNPDDPDSIEQLTHSPVSEFCPVVLDDGRIMYHRWEYIDKGHRTPKTLWAMNPDGTKTQELYGLDDDSTTVFTYAQPVPGNENKIVCVGTCHYPQGGSVGSIMLIDTNKDSRKGRRDPDESGYKQWDDRYAVVNLTDDVFVERRTQPGWRFRNASGGYTQDETGQTGHLYTHPFPISDKQFLVSYKMNESDHYKNVAGAYGIYLLDINGDCTFVYKDPDSTVSCWHPRPLLARKVPPKIYSFRHPTLAANNQALCIVTNVYEGMEGVGQGDVKWLRINEAFQRPWASNKKHLWQPYFPSQSWSGALWPRVQWGIVPVEEDGSAYFTVPADRNIFFQALDEDYREIQRERTYVNYRPGEYRSCIGCHERSGRTPGPIPTEAPIALRRGPSVPGPMPGETDPRQIIDFPNDIQAIFNAKCISCHGNTNPKGSLKLVATLTERYNVAYEQLRSKNLAGPRIAELTGNKNGSYLPPKSLGSYKSKLVNKLLDGSDAHSTRVTAAERLQIIRWVDSNYQFYSSYYGRWLETYKDHPNFRVRPTFEEATSMFAPSWHK